MVIILFYYNMPNFIEQSVSTNIIIRESLEDSTLPPASLTSNQILIPESKELFAINNDGNIICLVPKPKQTILKYQYKNNKYIQDIPTVLPTPIFNYPIIENGGVHIKRDEGKNGFILCFSIKPLTFPTNKILFISQGPIGYGFELSLTNTGSLQFYMFDDVKYGSAGYTTKSTLLLNQTNCIFVVFNISDPYVGGNTPRGANFPGFSSIDIYVNNALNTGNSSILGNARYWGNWDRFSFNNDAGLITNITGYSTLSDFKFTNISQVYDLLTVNNNDGIQYVLSISTDNNNNMYILSNGDINKVPRIGMVQNTMVTRINMTDRNTDIIMSTDLMTYANSITYYNDIIYICTNYVIPSSTPSSTSLSKSSSILDETIGFFSYDINLNILTKINNLQGYYLWADNKGNIYMVSNYSIDIKIYNNLLTNLLVLSLPNISINGITGDNNNNLYLSDYNNGNIYVVDIINKLIKVVITNTPTIQVEYNNNQHPNNLIANHNNQIISIPIPSLLERNTVINTTIINNNTYCRTLSLDFLSFTLSNTVNTVYTGCYFIVNSYSYIITDPSNIYSLWNLNNISDIITPSDNLAINYIWSQDNNVINNNNSSSCFFIAPNTPGTTKINLTVNSTSSTITLNVINSPSNMKKLDHLLSLTSNKRSSTMIMLTQTNLITNNPSIYPNLVGSNLPVYIMTSTENSSSGNQSVDLSQVQINSILVIPSIVEGFTIEFGNLTIIRNNNQLSVDGSSYFGIGSSFNHNDIIYTLSGIGSPVIFTTSSTLISTSISSPLIISPYLWIFLIVIFIWILRSLNSDPYY